MAPTSRLGQQLRELLAALEQIDARSALIGGLALAPHNVIRATRDVDLLADADRSDAIDRGLAAIGYRCMHRSQDAATYLRNDERVDFLFASRPVARRLLEQATPRETPFGALRVVGVEGLIAFKLQGFVNNPRRTQDLEDIRSLIRANRTTVDENQLREYFRLFDRETMLDEFLAEK